MDIAKCENGWEEDEDYFVELLNPKIIHESYEKYNDCYDNFDFSSKNCIEICK